MTFKEQKITVSDKREKEREVTIRKCNIDDLEEAILLQNRVYESIINKDTFVMTTREEFIHSLTFDFCIGVYENGVLKAMSILLKNTISSRNLGNYLGYDKQKLLKTVTFDATFIDPDLRGYSLQKLFINIRKNEAKIWGASEALVAVSLDNIYSLKNLLQEGFDPVDIQPLYGGLKRCIMRLKVE